MIEDSAQEVTSTPKAGQAFTATAFGGSAYDLGAAGVDPAIGEPLQALWQVTQDFNTLTSAVVDFGHADDAAGTNFISLATTGSVVLANLTAAIATMKRLGNPIPPQAITKRFLCAKLTVTGANPTLGKLRVLFQKGRQTIPANPGAL